MVDPVLEPVVEWKHIDGDTTLRDMEAYMGASVPVSFARVADLCLDTSDAVGHHALAAENTFYMCVRRR